MIKLAPKHKPLPQTAQREFIAQLKAAVVEKDVEAAYKHVFQRYYGTNFSSPYGTDGYMEPAQASLFEDDLRLFLEVKFGLDLTEPKERAKIIAQSIYYLKKFEADGKPLPNVVVGGDENQMFTMYTPKLKEYLVRDYDWSLAPSSAWRDNESLYRELLADPNLTDVYVFDVRSSAFDINQVFRSISALSQHHEEFEKLRVSEANIRMVFDEFVRVVWGNEWLTGIKKLGAAETVSVFIQSILGNPDTYIVPTKKNVLHLAGGKEITINAGSYNAFFSRYDRKYAVREIDTITAIADQLIEEVKRRFHGDFWTPTVWANRAIAMMDADLGEGWRDRYVVWDPAAGTKNLTRDYQFGKLFTSTLHQAEIDMSQQYNREATSFQYDFLNDDIDVSPTSDPRDLKMPPELFAALKGNEPMVFYTNPPYGQATTGGADNHKSGIAETRVGALMREQELRKASAELYAQFIWRVQKLSHDFNLTNVFFFFFNKGFLTSPVFGKFTDELLDQFRFNGGFMINAGEFQGTSSAWGIIFSNFQLKTEPTVRQTSFAFSVEGTGEDGGVEKITEHTLRRVAKGESLKDWLYQVPIPKEEYRGGKYPRTNGGFNVSISKAKTGTYREGGIGFLQFNGPTVQRADKYLNLNSTMMELGNQGRVLTRDNLERAAVTFAVGKSILPDASWTNDKDIFRRPSDEFQASSAWDEFVADCVVLSLFHRSSYQTSLRGFEYAGELYDVANEWFFMSRDESMAIAEQYDLTDIVYDARSSSERHVYTWLQGRQLSPHAQALLDAGRELMRATYAKRFIADSEHPEWHLMTWDAGYYQAYKITTMYREEFAEVMAALDVARRVLEAKLRTQVYKDGILEK